MASSTQNLQEVLSLLKDIENQTNKSNRALESYTRSWAKFNTQVNRSGGGSSSCGSSTSHQALDFVKNQGMSALASYSGKTGAQISSLTSSVGSLTTASAAAVGVVGAVALGLTAMATAGKKAASTNQAVARGLSQLGESQTRFTQDAINASNSMNRLRNSWSNTVLSIQQTFTPFLAWLADSATVLLSLVGGGSSDVNVAQATVARGQVATSARSQGFSSESAKNLSNGLYNMALTLGERHGLDPNDVIKDLESSVFGGSNSASSYGLFSDDATLTGYMSTKGIDSVSTEVTEATKSYQRFLLLQDQLNGSVGEDSVNAFRKLGNEITKTRQALFSFDEVITLQGYDSSIPEVGHISSIAEDTELKDFTSMLKDLSGFTTYQRALKSFADGVTEIVGNLNSLNLNGLSESLEGWMSDLYSYLQALGVEIPVGLFVPEEEKEKLTGDIGAVPVSVPVTFESLVTDFNSWIESLAGALGVSVPVGLELLEGQREKIKQELTGLSFNLPVNLEGVSSQLSAWMGELSQMLQGVSIPAPVAVPVSNTIDVQSSENLADALGQVINTDLVYSLDANAQGILSQIYSQTAFLSQKIQENTSALTGNNNQISSLNQFYTQYQSLLNSLSSTSSMNQGQQFLSSITGSSFSANQGASTTQTATQQAQASGSYSQMTLGQKVQSGLTAVGQNLKKFIGGSDSNHGLGLTDSLSQTTNSIGAGLAGLSGLSLLPMGLPLFADGGIASDALVGVIGEAGAEAVIPLESDGGVDYLAKAMNRAFEIGGGSSSQTYNITLPGNVFINNEAQLNRLAEVIASKISIQNSRRGNL